MNPRSGAVLTAALYPQKNQKQLRYSRLVETFTVELKCIKHSEQKPIFHSNGVIFLFLENNK